MTTDISPLIPVIAGGFLVVTLALWGVTAGIREVAVMLHDIVTELKRRPL